MDGNPLSTHFAPVDLWFALCEFVKIGMTIIL